MEKRVLGRTPSVYRSRQSAAVIDAVGIRISSASGRGNRESLCARLRNRLDELVEFPRVFTFENTELKITSAEY